MLKYYTYLFKIRILLKDKYDLELLRNLEKFPLRTDPKLKEYLYENCRTDKES